MTVYNQHRYKSVFIGQTGHSHRRATPDDLTPTAITCDACEPFLVKEGWVHDPKTVPLTDRQLAEQERVTKEGNAALLSFQRSLASSAADALVTGGGNQAVGVRERAPRRRRAAKSGA